MIITEGAYNQRVKELAAIITPELLQQVKYMVELCGWSVDFIETARFVEWCYEVANQPKPEMESITIVDE